MKFFLVCVFTVLFNSVHAQWLQRECWSEVWKGSEEQPSEPQWWQQYYRMKKNAEGKIPRLPYVNIETQMTNNVSRQQLIFNVEQLGPQNIGGRTRSILIDPDNSNHLFAGSVSGGIWVSNDAGASWNPVNDFMQSLSVTSLAQDAHNHNLIYAGTGESDGNSEGVPGDGVFKSEDGGISFSHLASTDSSDFNYIHKISVSPADSGWLYVATNNGGLLRSVNGGDTFQKVFATTKAVDDIEILPSGATWIGINNLGLFYSANGDSGTFVSAMNGLPAASDFKRVEFAIAPSDTLIMYCALEDATGGYYSGLLGMYKTTDGGQNWIQTFDPDNDYGFYFSFPWYSMTMAIKPDDPNFVLCAVGDFAYTTDGGTEWNVADDSHADYHASLFDPADPNKIYMGNDGGVWRYNVSQLWYNHENLNNSYATVQYYAGSFFPQGKSAYAGAQDNGTQACIQGENNFNLIFGGDGAYNAVNQQYGDIGYASYQNGTIHRTDDATSPFPIFYPVMNQMDVDGDYVIDDGAWFINPFEINLVNGDNMYFTTLQRIWITNDGAFDWYPLTNVLVSGTPYAIGISNDVNPRIYIGGEYGLFFRVDSAVNSSPGDEVYLSGTLPPSVTNDFISCITVHPDSSSVCYVAFSNNSDVSRVWRVQYDGTFTHWQNISGDLPVGLPVNYICVDPLRPDSFFLAGTDFGLYVSNDGGQHWIKDFTIPNVPVFQVKIRYTDRRVFIYTHGRGMWSATLDSIYIGTPPIPSSDLDVSVYPNPFSDQLICRSTSDNFSVELFDLTGKELLASTNNNQLIAFDLSTVSSGCYIMKIISGEKIITRKVMKE